MFPLKHHVYVLPNCVVSKLLTHCAHTCTGILKVEVFIVELLFNFTILSKQHFYCLIHSVYVKQLAVFYYAVFIYNYTNMQVKHQYFHLCT